MNIDKAQVLKALRDRGLDDRAEWVDKQFPDDIDVAANKALLSMLGIDVAELAEHQVKPGA